MKTVDDVVQAFGGPAQTARIFQVVPSAVSNWKKAGRFPSRLHLKILREANARGIAINESVLSSESDEGAA